MDKKKILFVIPSLAGGGAERVLVHLLRHLDRNRFNPSVVVFSSKNDYQEEIHENVNIILLEKRKRTSFFGIIKSLSKIIKKESPFIICSFLTYANYLSVLEKSLSGSKARLFLTEHANLSVDLKHENFQLIKKIMIRTLYPKADWIITVSNGVKKDIVSNFGIPEEKCRVIYNPVDIDRIQALAMEEVSHIWFKEEMPVLTACGRLTIQKNYPMLLRSIKAVSTEIAVRVIVLGEGEKRTELEAYAKKLGIHNNVAFLGFQKNPFKFMANSDLFVSSSLWEGFSNVLIEAMTCGIPVISTNCPSGPNEIITHEANGLLVPVNDKNAMAEAILRLLKDEPLRKNLAEAGRKRAEDFRVEKIVKKYEALFSETETIKC